ncbi:MAG TPA: S8 family serine peptidase [bacterium]|nr:S8 family serine peptidase [bacterium]
MKHIVRRIGTVLALLTLLAVTVIPAGAGGRASDGPTAAQGSHDYVMVRLADFPTASYPGGIPGLERTKPLPGRKLDLGSNAARAYGRYLADKRQAYKGWLASNAGRAQVVREFSVVFNGLTVRLNGERLERLAEGPGVAAVAPSALYRPAMTISTGLIRAAAVWPAAGGRSNAGAGIKVGIIDTGIRDDHPAFDCKGTIPHKVFASGEAAPPNNRPVIVFNHGTHVAGTVAGCVMDLTGPEPLAQGGPTEGTWSGVAPGAELHDYNVFPGFGAGFRAFGGSAFSHDICAALETAVADGMDVVNMSLGGGVQGPHDFLAECTNGVADAGVVPAVAAGNSGPGDSTAESPGSAAGAFTAGASTNPHFVGIPATFGRKTFGAALGDFENFGLITAPYTRTTPANGCTAISPALAGKIAIIDRGACSFTTKIRNAQAAGAVGVLVVNNVAGDPVGMAHDGTEPKPTIPAAMLGKAEGSRASIGDSGTVTVDGTAPREFITQNADIIAGFSSRGPTPFTFLVKPDATAPGVNVFSAVFDEITGDLGWAYFQGTSMATPHFAGAAALLKALHPTWSPADIKSALTNTADRVVTDHVNAARDPGPLARGGGRINVEAAHGADLLLEPVSVSFGRWLGNVDVQAQRSVALRNVSGGDLTCGVDLTGPKVVRASPTSFNISAGGSATLTLTLDAGRSAGSGDYFGDLELDCRGTTARAVWWVRIDRLAKP